MCQSFSHVTQVNTLICGRFIFSVLPSTTTVLEELQSRVYSFEVVAFQKLVLRVFCVMVCARARSVEFVTATVCTENHKSILFSRMWWAGILSSKLFRTKGCGFTSLKPPKIPTLIRRVLLSLCSCCKTRILLPSV